MLVEEEADQTEGTFQEQTTMANQDLIEAMPEEGEVLLPLDVKKTLSPVKIITILDHEEAIAAEVQQVTNKDTTS